MKRTEPEVMLSNSLETNNYLLQVWDRETIDTRESVYLILLNYCNRVIFCQRLAIGDENSCKFRIQEVLQLAIKHNACGLVLAHNHPKNNPNPSNVDISTTQELFIKCKYLGIKLIDHIIVTATGRWTSIEKMGYFKDYSDVYNQMINIRKKGTYENTAFTVMDLAFKSILSGVQCGYAFKQMNEKLEKVYIKYFDPII